MAVSASARIENKFPISGGYPYRLRNNHTFFSSIVNWWYNKEKHCAT